MPKKWILIVDDDPLMLQMMEEVLVSSEFMVTTASDAIQAFIQARDLKPALIISDVQMPIFGTGDVTLRELRKDERLRSIPFIFMTGLDIEKAKALLPLNDKTVRLVTKPIDWEKLKQMITELCGLHVG